MFFPFHGTFFLSRGGPGAGEGAATGTAGVAGSIAARHGRVSLGGGGGGLSSVGVSIVISAPDPVSSLVSIFSSGESEKFSCFNVSVLCCLLCATLDDILRGLSLDSKKRLRVGVLGSVSWSNQSPSPEIDPLNEECSLSPGSSLSQLFRSPDSPPVCWRIQSSVKPCAGRRARYARTAALMRPSLDTNSGSVEVLVNVGAGRKNGVWNSS